MYPVLILAFVLVPNWAKSQDYNNAIGLRAGLTSGLTIKHFMGNSRAIEGIIGIWPYSTSITGLYEVYKGAGAAGLNWYYGGGAHASFYTGRIYYNRYYDRYYRAYDDHAFGLDLILGLEYKIPEIPFALSLDIKPFLEIHRGGGTYTALDPGLGLKIAF
ncbi:MAG: hypothetical protein KG003_05130 [Bacteroidetes bacterium]|nr:hypothetical protein [Bacteroidota bacterium]